MLLAGPTASGKSALAMELAARDGRLVVNADALQVYANWRILTARPSLADEAALPHALYGHVPRDIAYSAGHWLHDLAPLLARPVVIVGGTGLYFAALTEGLAVIPPISAATRALADALLRDEGLSVLLAGLDAPTAARIDRANPARVQRAWEVLHETGRGLADWQQDTGAPLLSLNRADPWVLRPSTDWLDRRIAARFDAMIRDGALDEVRSELPHWPAGQAPDAPPLPSMRAIGAPELVAHLQGRLTLPEARAQAVLASRQYAKRQRTWMRSRMREWHEIRPD